MVTTGASLEATAWLLRWIEKSNNDKCGDDSMAM
jgi:hypothetical protein